MSSNQKLMKSIEHVQYEWNMFKITASSLMRGVKDVAINNVFLESFAIHTRNLLEFFYSGVKHKFSDDIIAEDYIIHRKYFLQHRTPKRLLKFIEKKANKQISHLTYHRIKYSRYTKPWPTQKIYTRLEKTMSAFIQALPVERKSWFTKCVTL